jgi:two-component system sensor histidine kinase RegB
LKSEILLLETQANRCKQILLNLSKNPQNMQDTFLKKTTISSLVNLNFEKFLKNKNNLKTNIETLPGENEPLINFSDEIMYGLGNIIQNATEHAKNKIDVNISWDKEYVFISVKDDGKGFTKEVLDNVGSPFISRKNSENSMGLGIFIAKNLIENIGGNIKFYNKTDNFGSVVEILLKKNI